MVDLLTGNKIMSRLYRTQPDLMDKVWKTYEDLTDLFYSRKQKVEICRSYKFLMLKPLIVHMFERLATHALPKAEVAIQSRAKEIVKYGENTV